jgi:hypothetical protein
MFEEQECLRSGSSSKTFEPLESEKLNKKFIFNRVVDAKTKHNFVSTFPEPTTLWQKNNPVFNYK